MYSGDVETLLDNVAATLLHFHEDGHASASLALTWTK